MKSPALDFQSEHFPPAWKGRVPKTIRMATNVRPDLSEFFQAKPGVIACYGEEYPCWVNSHGAAAVILSNGEKIGVRPYEFEVVEWH